MNNFKDFEYKGEASVLGAYYEFDRFDEEIYTVSLKDGDYLNLKEKVGYWGKGRTWRGTLYFLQREMEEGKSIYLFCDEDKKNFYAIRTCSYTEVGTKFEFHEDQSGCYLGEWYCIAEAKMSEMDTLISHTGGQERVYLGCFK